MSNLLFIRRVLYKLKRNYGFKVSLYKILESHEDAETGRKVRNRSVHEVRKAVILSATDLKRTFNHNRAFAAVVTSKFGYGGFYDTESLYIVIDARDLPRDLPITLEDFIIYQHRRYGIDEAEEIQPGLGWILKTREIKGNQPTEIISKTIEQSLPLTQAVEGEL